MTSATLVTHPDFRSLHPAVKDAETMDECLSEAIYFQFMFEKRTTPWEAQQWDYEALQQFEVNLEKIDRLYYIAYESNRTGGERRFKMIARMEYEDQSLYVELNAGCDFSGFCFMGGGNIFISRDANLFMKLVLAEPKCDINKDLIYESLRNDSIYVEEDDTHYDQISRTMWKNAPMLKYLCHEAIYQNRDALRGYGSLLPKILKESVDDFIKTEDARKAYYNYQCIVEMYDDIPVGGDARSL